MAWGLRHISSRELSEWQAYESLEPSGNEYIARLLEQLIVMYANAHRDSKKKTTPYTLEEMFPHRAGEEVNSAPSPSTLLEKMMAINTALGGADTRNGNHR